LKPKLTEGREEEEKKFVGKFQYSNYEGRDSDFHRRGVVWWSID